MLNGVGCFRLVAAMLNFSGCTQLGVAGVLKGGGCTRLVVAGVLNGSDCSRMVVTGVLKAVAALGWWWLVC